MTSPKHLLQAWEEIQRRIGKARQLVLLSDFDGTLAPIRKDPDQARLSHAVRQSLSTLASRGVTVGIVSGRTITDVRPRVQLSGIWYVGSHGFAIQTPKGRLLLLATPRQKRAVTSARRELVRSLGKVAGLRIEAKPVSVAVHYRSAPRRSRLHGLDAVQRVLHRQPGLRLLAGKKVWEVLPDSPKSKWSGVQYLLRHVPPSDRLIFYLGDDRSDEEVFAKLRGVSVVVGRYRQTNARYYLRSPAEVGRLLQRFQRAVFGAVFG
jgi:trehalose-phosphatase